MESFAGPVTAETNRLRLAFRVRRAQSQPPRLNIHAAIPEMRVGRGNRNVHGPCRVEADEFVIRSGVGHVHPLVVHRDSEEAVAHLIGNGRGLNTRPNLRSTAGSAESTKMETRSARKPGNRQTLKKDSGNQTNVALKLEPSSESQPRSDI